MEDNIVIKLEHVWKKYPMYYGDFERLIPEYSE